MKTLLAALLFVVLLGCSESSSGIAANGEGTRMLALLDNLAVRETHSHFFRSLRARGFQLTFRLADDPELALAKYGEYNYDHLVLFCPNVVEFGGSVSTKAVVDFIDAGGKLLIFLFM